MMTTAIRMIISIGRNDVSFDLSFIYQNYTMLQYSPKQNDAIYEKGVFKRRELVALF